MRKLYTHPELEIRKYTMRANSVTTSDPAVNPDNDLNKDDNVDYFE